MATTVTRNIGLSLGADICWPKCFEDILSLWHPEFPIGDEKVKFSVDRVTINPFDLKKPVEYDVVVDRLTHWHANTREWIKKAVILDDVYVFNNPWSVQSMEKQTSYAAMMRLGMPIPETWMVPPKEYEPNPDLDSTLRQYASLFDLETIGEALGYPVFMKPYDGGGWVGVTKADDTGQLRDAYEASGKYLMHVQEGILPWSHFVRCVGIGPQLRVIAYDPDAPLHGRYTPDFDHLAPDDLAHLRAVTLTVNAFFGWDFNSCECLERDGVWYPIDYANPCPDSQVTSLDRHFPWLVLAKIRWALFCAATQRPFRRNLDWQPFFDIADTDATYLEKLEGYSRLAEAHFSTDEFEAFCAEHLGPLEEIAWEYFGSEDAKDAVRQKVTALYPGHEIEEFTERFWAAIQVWRDHDSPVAPR